MPIRKAKNMSEILSILNELSSNNEEDQAITASKDVDIVYIPPPQVECITDEEDLDDDRININDTNDDFTKEIAGTVELQYQDADNDLESEVEEHSTSSVRSETKQKACIKGKLDFIAPVWRKPRNFSYTRTPKNIESIRIEEVYAVIGSKSPYDIFSLYFDNSIIEEIANFSNEYAHQNNATVNITPKELRRFIGILYLSGYHTLPHVNHYWSAQPDMGVSMVKQAMSRNRFKTIKRYLHLADNNNLSSADRFAKVRPLVDAINKKFMQFGVFSHILSIDEQMIPYFGRHSCKMFIKGKPIRFGFKSWCLCSANGYLFSSILYGGSATPYNKNIGLGAQTVLDLLSNVSDPEDHVVFFDNFFSSYHLMCLLNERKFFGTGTIRENRMGNCPLKNLKKSKRGESDHLLESEQQILAVRWNDNSVVNVITNNSTIEPMANAKRYCRKLKKTITIEQPKVIQEYNQGMGGVDLHDNAVANYRICIKGKKWWWPIWINILGNAMVNAWKVHCMLAKIDGSKPLSQIEFRSEVTRQLLTYDKDTCKVDDGEYISNLPQSNEKIHAITKSCENKYRRCKVCKKHTIFICKKCHLHTKCFYEYHKNCN